MNRGKVLNWTVLAVLMLCVAGPALAQDAPPDLPVWAPLPPLPVTPPSESLLGIEDSSLYQLLDEARATHFFTRAEYLLLTPRRGALDFAVLGPNQGNPAVGSVGSLDWKANSGIRVGGGIRLSPEGWELGATYTYFHTSADGTLAAPPGGSLIATRTNPDDVNAVNSAVAGSSFNYQLLDLDVGRRFQTSSSFSGYLGGGGRVASIDQSFNAFYNGQTAARAAVSNPINFNGGGLRFGGEGQWNMLGGFGVFGRAFGSMLVGNNQTSQTETNNAGATLVTALSDQFRKVIPVAELGLGLSWQGQNVRARLGYEIANWFNLVDTPDFSNGKYSRRASDLSLDGLSIMFEWNY